MTRIDGRIGWLKTGTVAALLALTVPLAAQTPDVNPAAVEEPTPARLAAARELLDIIMPPGQRAALMTEAIGPMIDNLQSAMMQSPQYQAALEENPGAEELMRQFLANQRARVLTMANSDLPGLIEASARAYARRFTAREMRDIREFFETASGQTYLRQANAIMADPDIAAWQRNLMIESMQDMQADIGELAEGLEALAADGAATGDQAVTNSNLDAMRGGNDTSESETEE